MPFPTNFPLNHFTGGKWCFVTENKKRNLFGFLILVTPTGFKPVTF